MISEHEIWSPRMVNLEPQTTALSKHDSLRGPDVGGHTEQHRARFAKLLQATLLFLEPGQC